jgi:hypothetical protein
MLQSPDVDTVYTAAAALQAVKDPFIWVPNGVGGVFAVLLIALCLIFRRKATAPATGQQGLL